MTDTNPDISDGTRQYTNFVLISGHVHEVTARADGVRDIKIRNHSYPDQAKPAEDREPLFHDVRIHGASTVPWFDDAVRAGAKILVTGALIKMRVVGLARSVQVLERSDEKGQECIDV